MEPLIPEAPLYTLYIYIHTHIYLHTHTHIYLHIHTHTHTSKHYTGCLMLNKIPAQQTGITKLQWNPQHIRTWWCWESSSVLKTMATIPCALRCIRKLGMAHLVAKLITLQKINSVLEQLKWPHLTRTADTQVFNTWLTTCLRPWQTVGMFLPKFV